MNNNLVYDPDGGTANWPKDLFKSCRNKIFRGKCKYCKLVQDKKRSYHFEACETCWNIAYHTKANVK